MTCWREVCYLIDQENMKKESTLFFRKTAPMFERNALVANQFREWQLDRQNSPDTNGVFVQWPENVRAHREFEHEPHAYPFDLGSDVLHVALRTKSPWTKERLEQWLEPSVVPLRWRFDPESPHGTLIHLFLHVRSSWSAKQTWQAHQRSVTSI